ncbi:hypothetical protein F5X97DRAFT_324831 [Nemania serpens]|nr:hypothetical protein F5X97DRAFT_324831 [Nemania serpens]
MSFQPYKSEVLLAELRAATSSNVAEECEMCDLQHKIACVHLTGDQYASLKAKKRRKADDQRNGVVLRVFGCGHVYRSLTRVWRNVRGPKTKTEGLCPVCWRYIATDGRRICKNPGMVRRTPKPKLKLKTSHESDVDVRRATRPKVDI